MASRRAKPVKNFDEVHITNLEDDFDEFSMNDDIKPVKLPSDPVTKKSGLQNNKTEGTTLKLNGIETMKQQTIARGTVASTASTKVSGNKSLTTDYEDRRDKNGNLGADVRQGPGFQPALLSETKLHGSSTTQTQQASNFGLLSARSSTSTTSKISQSSLTSARGSTTTPLNLRNPVSSVQIKRLPVNKNEKGFGHDAQDLVIDDIEEF